MSNSLWPHGLQHARFPCPSPSPGACSNSCPLRWWCHPAIYSSVFPFSSCLQSFPASMVFSSGSALHISWPKYWSFSLSISLPNEYSVLISFRMDWLDLLGSKGLSRVFSNITVQKHQFFGTQPSFIVWLSHPYMTAGKTIALTIWTFAGKEMSLLFNMLYSFVIAYLPRSKHLLISWLQPPSAVILEPKKRKSLTVSILSLSISHKVMGPNGMILVVWMSSFKLAFSLFSVTFITFCH